MAKKIPKAGLLFLALGSLFLYAGRAELSVGAETLSYGHKNGFVFLLVLGIILFIFGGVLMIGSVAVTVRKK